ncbi:hypothetical protein G6011_05280 [Alternaria panax]|uniref:Uncharacterized protein n=1 Tax=Alternaria panax TaxID=48097 RepID=A0AAD4I8Y8_9PLEO|nr:hypothetical protein G6011_05280 [Alternaria panax]
MVHTLMSQPGGSVKFHSIPSCTQCRSSSLPCHYQEGGKRGLPAAYITALEKRLADTEAALSAALTTLQTQDTIRLTEGRLSVAISQASQPQRSKAERLEEWKRLPLQTDEQLAVWLQARYPDSGAQETSQSRPSDPMFAYQAQSVLKAIETRPNSNAHPFRETHGSTATSAPPIQQLRDCDMPSMPNAPRESSIQWRDNYF